MTPTVQALSREQFVRGEFSARPGAVAIRIGDPCAEFTPVNHGFHREHRFEFADVESPADRCWDAAMTPEQATEIAQILRQALAEQRDVVVHCNRGESRSVAVVWAAYELAVVRTPPEREIFLSIDRFMPQGNSHVYSALLAAFVSSTPVAHATI